MPTARTIRPTLNFDTPEPNVATDSNASALFPEQPIYARTSSRKTSSNLPVLNGVPALAIVAGGLLWAASANRTEAPTDQQSLKTAAAESPAPKTAAPVPSTTADTPAPLSRSTELAANTPVTKAPAPALLAARPHAVVAARPASRRAAPSEAPDVSSASANVSATVPVAPTVSTPAVEAPPPLVIPPAATPQPAPQAVPDTTNPM